MDSDKNQQTRYPEFTPEELDNFSKLLDIDKNGTINMADLEETSRMLGLENFYSNIKNQLKPLINVNLGGIPISDFKYYLSNISNDDNAMIEDIFEYYDYDKKGYITKHKLKIIAQEMGLGKLDDEEAEEMVKIISGKRGEVDFEGFKKISELKF